MTTFADSESNASVRSKINAAITTVDSLVSNGASTDARYATRQEFVNAVAGGLSLANGSIVAAAGLLYEADSAATGISDLTGFKPFGRLHLEHLADNMTPGTTNMATALTDALLFGEDIYLLNTAYLFERSSGFWTLSGQKIIGVGKDGPLITFKRDATSGSITFFRVTNGSVRDCNIVMDSTNPTDTGTLSFILPNGDNVSLIDCSLDGGSTGSNWDGNVFIASDTTSGNDGIASGCNFVNTGWFFLKTNGATSGHNGWKVVNNRFKDMRKPATINSPNGDAVDWLWQGNSFDTNSNAGGFGHISGCAGGDGFRFVANYFTGTCDECLHFEESDRFVVTDNVANVDGAFVQVLENGVGPVSNKSNDECVIANNTAIGTQTSGDHGIFLVDDGGGPSNKRIIIIGNTLRNFDRGISTGDQFGTDIGNIIANNSIYNCNTGILGANAHYGIRDNDLINCTTGLSFSERGGAVGRHRFVSVTTPITPTNGPISMDGAIIEMDEVTIPTGDQNIDLIALPAKFAAQITVNANYTNTMYHYAVYDASWDGVTETGFTTETILVSAGTLSSPDMAQDGTNLQFNVNNLSGASRTARISVLIDGPMIYT